MHIYRVQAIRKQKLISNLIVGVWHLRVFARENTSDVERMRKLLIFFDQWTLHFFESAYACEMLAKLHFVHPASPPFYAVKWRFSFHDKN